MKWVNDEVNSTEGRVYRQQGLIYERGLQRTALFIRDHRVYSPNGGVAPQREFTANPALKARSIKFK